MKLLKIAIKHIVSKIKYKPLLLFVLVLGVFISSVCSVLFYAIEMDISSNFDVLTGKNKVIDLSSHGVSIVDSFDEIRDYSETEIGEVSFYCLSGSCYEFDVIGIDGAEFVGVIKTEGRWCYNSLEAVICEGSFNGATLGDIIDIGGKKFSVSGIYSADIYTPEMYSDLLNDNENKYGVFINIADFDCLNIPSDNFRIRTARTIKAKDVAHHAGELESIVPGFKAYQITTNKSASFGDIWRDIIDCVSQIGLYFVLIALSIVNIMQIFRICINRDRKPYLQYLTVGARLYHIYIIASVEIFIYVLLGFLPAWYIANIIIDSTRIRYIAPVMTNGIAVLLFFAIYIVSAITGIWACKSMLVAKEEKPVQQSKLPTHKITHIVRRTYSKSLFLEFLIFLQIFFISFVLAVSSSWYFNNYTGMLDVKKAVGNDDFAIMCYRPSYSGEPLAGSYDENGYDNLVLRLKEQLGNKNVGALYFSYLAGDDSYPANERPGFPLNQTDEAILSRINLKVEGEWLKEYASGVDIAEDEFVPVVISEFRADLLGAKVGDTYKNIMFMNGNTNTVFTVKIVGIIKSNEKYLSLSSYPLNADSILSSQTETSYSCYCPRLYENGKPVTLVSERKTHIVIFPNNSSFIEEIPEELKMHGEIKTLNQINSEYNDYIFTGNSNHLIELIAASLLLYVGIFGYNILLIDSQKWQNKIYYVCGMSKGLFLRNTFVSGGLIFLVGGIFGAILGIYMGTVTRFMSNDSIAATIIFCVMYVAILFLISSLIIYFMLIKVSPSDILKRGE